MASAQELRELTVDDLRERVRSLDEELFQLRVKKAMGQLEGPVTLREMRRDLARIKTVLRERERAE
jgi:large subunit ribosomal protein L29